MRNCTFRIHARPGLAAAALTTLCLTAVATGCGKKDEAAAPASAQAAMAPSAPKPAEPAKATDKPAEPAKAADPAKPAEPAKPDPAKAGDAVDAYIAALEATPKCPLAEDNVAAKDYSTCLQPVWDAAKAIDDPPGANYEEKQAKSKVLKAKLAQQLALALSHRNQTVVLYALFQNQTRFELTPTVISRLDQLMDDQNAQIAEWATIARFWKRDKTDSPTIEKAKGIVKDHKQPRVRLGAVQYLGDRIFKGDRAHFDLLKSYADNKGEDKLIRGAAITAMGTIGDDKDVKAIASYLGEVDLQYSAVYALSNGISTKPAFDAYIDYFSKAAKKPDAIDFGALIIFVPFDSHKKDFDAAKARKAMEAIAAAQNQKPYVVENAKKALDKLAGW